MSRHVITNRTPVAARRVSALFRAALSCPRSRFSLMPSRNTVRCDRARPSSSSKHSDHPSPSGSHSYPQPLSNRREQPLVVLHRRPSREEETGLGLRPPTAMWPSRFVFPPPAGSERIFTGMEQATREGGGGV